VNIGSLPFLGSKYKSKSLSSKEDGDSVKKGTEIIPLDHDKINYIQNTRKMITY
jgi:hypothetical protein